jgi:hypothetical protein
MSLPYVSQVKQEGMCKDHLPISERASHPAHPQKPKGYPMVLKHSSYTGEEVRSDAEGDRGNIILHEFRKN